MALRYDAALRLTNEIYYTNSVAQTTNSYGYDASGNRVAGRARPDFILSSVPPTETRRGNKALLIGDFKLSGNSLYSQDVEPGNKQTQFSAIANFTAKNTELRIALFITVTKGNKGNFAQVPKKMIDAGLKKGTLFIVVSTL